MLKINDPQDRSIPAKKSEQNSLGKSYLLNEPIKDEVNFGSSEEKPKKNNILLWVLGLGAIATGIIIALKKHNPKEIEKVVTKEKNEISETVKKTSKKNNQSHNQKINNNSKSHKNNNSHKKYRGFSGGGSSRGTSYGSYKPSSAEGKSEVKSTDTAGTAGTEAEDIKPKSGSQKVTAQSTGNEEAKQPVITEEKIIKPEVKSTDTAKTEGAKTSTSNPAINAGADGKGQVEEKVEKQVVNETDEAEKIEKQSSNQTPSNTSEKKERVQELASTLEALKNKKTVNIQGESAPISESKIQSSKADTVKSGDAEVKPKGETQEVKEQQVDAKDTKQPINTEGKTIESEPKSQSTEAANTEGAKSGEETIKAADEASNSANTATFKSQVSKIIPDEVASQLDYSKPSEVISTILSQKDIKDSSEFLKVAYDYLSMAKIAEPIEAEKIKLSKMYLLGQIKQVSAEPQMVKAADGLLDKQLTEYLEGNLGKNGADIGFDQEDFAKLKHSLFENINIKNSTAEAEKLPYYVYIRNMELSFKKLGQNMDESSMDKKLEQVGKGLFKKYNLASEDEIENLDPVKKKEFIQDTKSGVLGLHDDMTNNFDKNFAQITSKFDNMLSKVGVSSDSEMYKNFTVNVKDKYLANFHKIHEALSSSRAEIIANMEKGFKTSDEVLQELTEMTKGNKKLETSLNRQQTNLANTLEKLNNSSGDVKISIINDEILPIFDNILMIKYDPKTTEEEIKFIEKYDEYLTKIILKNGVDKIPVTLEEQVNINLHKIIDTQKTDNPELDGKIAGIFREGFAVDDGRILRQPEVIMYKYTA